MIIVSIARFSVPGRVCSGDFISNDEDITSNYLIEEGKF